jgi:hypothetical protein
MSRAEKQLEGLQDGGWMAGFRDKNPEDWESPPPALCVCDWAELLVLSPQSMNDMNSHQPMAERGHNDKFYAAACYFNERFPAARLSLIIKHLH